MKKITIMSIVLAILVAMTTTVFAAETSTIATVTAPAEVVATAGNTVEVTITFKDKVAFGVYNINLGTAGVLEYSSNNVGAVQRTDGSFAFAKSEAEAIDKIVMTYKVAEGAKAGASTTVTFAPVAGKFGADVEDVKTINVSGTPTVTLKATATEPTKPTDTTKPTDATTPTDTTEPTETATPTDKDENTVATTAANGDDTYDQTGMNVGIVAGIALAVVIGTAVVVKRK